MEQGGDVLSVFTRLSVIATAIEEGVKKQTGVEEAFMKHPIFGILTCCPSNIGTGMRGSVHILVPKVTTCTSHCALLLEVRVMILTLTLVPKLIAKIGFDEIDKMCRARNCQARGSSGEHSAVVDRIDVSNWRRIGFPEWTLVDDMIQVTTPLSY
jgi:creatine kinase